MDEESKQVQLRTRAAALADQVLARTAGQASELQVAIERLARGESQVLQEMHALAHKIHGGGAIFGFPDISERGGQLEEITGALIENRQARTGNAPIVHELGNALQALTECVEQLAQAVSSAAAQRKLNSIA